MSEPDIDQIIADCEGPPRRHSFGHPDDIAVNRFAAAMKEKMAASRAKGRSGWQQCESTYLLAMLREHVEKGDMRDVANIAMMIWTNEGRAAGLVDGE